MSERTVFDRLAVALPREERERILASIRTDVETTLAPIAPVPESPPPDIDEQLRTLGFFNRIRLFLVRLFSTANREEIVSRWTLNRLRHRMHRAGTTGINAQQGVFTEEFALSLESVQRAMARTALLLDPIQDNRAELIFRLAADELPIVNRDLLNRTSERYLEEHDEKNEQMMKRSLSRYLDERLAEIPRQRAARMRRSVAQVDRLIRIAQFPFATMIGSFSGSAEEGTRYCPFDYLAHSLERLVSEIARFADPLEQNAIETIAVMSCEQDPSETPELFQGAVQKAFGTLVTAVAALRDIAQTYPLLSIVRLVKENPWWEPEPSDETGNDWLAVYRHKLEERIGREVLRVSLHRQVREQIAIVEEITEVEAVPFEGLPKGRDALFLRHYHTAMVVWSFSHQLRRSTVTPLRLILTGAEFYKSSNRAQFNDAFNDYEQIPVEIGKIATLVAREGDWGTLLHGDEPIEKRREMAARVDEELFQLVSGIQTNLEMLTNLLGGILYARPGSPYDTIANYGQIGGRRNAELIDEIKHVHSALQRIVGVIGEIGALEKRAGENDMFIRPVT